MCPSLHNAALKLWLNSESTKTIFVGYYPQLFLVGLYFANQTKHLISLRCLLSCSFLTIRLGLPTTCRVLWSFLDPVYSAFHSAQQFWFPSLMPFLQRSPQLKLLYSTWDNFPLPRLRNSSWSHLTHRVPTHRPAHPTAIPLFFCWQHGLSGLEPLNASKPSVCKTRTPKSTVHIRRITVICLGCPSVQAGELCISKEDVNYIISPFLKINICS